MKPCHCLTFGGGKKKKRIHPFPEDQFERRRGLQCDVLTWLMSVRSDKQYSQKCSEGPRVPLPDIYPSQLIEKHIGGAFTLHSAYQTTPVKSVGCDQTRNNPLNLPASSLHE